MLTWVSLLLCCSPAATDLLVRTVTVNNVNYDDFSLLCAEGIPLLMEDHKPRPCQPRPWKAEQKCPAGFWCHEGDDESSYYCCPRSRKVSNHCHLPPATGFGKQLMRRFYYDWKTDGCHELHYTGIGGNENSYMTYESCETACRGAGEPTPKVFGGLSTSKEDKKNPEKDKNGKNKNKGPTISFTISSTEVPEVLPSSKIVEIPSYSALTSTTTKVTEPGITKSSTRTSSSSTRSSTPATTMTMEIPEEMVSNPCILPPERGTSGGIARKMWYFDISTLSCIQFTYQGSGGNPNRFDNSRKCMAVCGIGKPNKKACDLPASVGEGPFKIPRFFFDSKTQRCELFYYSGENGNDNRFFKKHKCERLCLGKASKKKEQTRMPEPVTFAPTRKIVNFVSSETQPPTAGFDRARVTTAQPPMTIEIERPIHVTRKPAQPKTEHTHYERFETKTAPHVVDLLPETTAAPTTSTTPLFYTMPPTTPAPSTNFIQTETVRPMEPQTFPTLVYVAKGEDLDATQAPYIHPPLESTQQTAKPLDELFNHLMTVKLPTFTQAPPQQPVRPDPVASVPKPTNPPVPQTQQAYQTISQIVQTQFPYQPQPNTLPPRQPAAQATQTVQTPPPVSQQPYFPPQVQSQPQPTNVVQPYQPLPQAPQVPRQPLAPQQPQPMAPVQQSVPHILPPSQPQIPQQLMVQPQNPQHPMIQTQQTQQPMIQPQVPQQPLSPPVHQPLPPPVFTQQPAVQPHPTHPPPYPGYLQPQQPMVPVQQPGQGPYGYTTGIPTIVEKSHIGPVPETHIPLGNFPWETTPAGYTMPPGVNPPIYVGTNEQLEAMIKAMGGNPLPSHHVHTLPQQTVAPPQPPAQPAPHQPSQIYQGIRPAEPPPGSMISIPSLQRQWGTSPQPYGVPQPGMSQQFPNEPIQPQQPQVIPPQIGFQSLPNVAVPNSSSGSQIAPKQAEHGVDIQVQATQPPAAPVAPFVPTQQQIPGTVPPSFIHHGPMGSFQPHPGAANNQPVYVKEIPTETFSVNLANNTGSVGSFHPHPSVGLLPEPATNAPVEVFPRINVSIVNDLNSPCQLPVTDPDVVIMCEQNDVHCPMGSFCQIGMGQSICCPRIGGNPCYQPLQRGVGVAQLVRWFYNPLTKRCHTFSFGGFQSNENNFLTYSDCQNTCGAMNPCKRGQPVPATNPEQTCSATNRCPADSMCHSVETTSYCCNEKVPVSAPQTPQIDNDPCHQPIVEGSGTAADHRWAFDHNLGRCISFIYQGEHGNLNNFLTKSDCQAICGAPPTVPSRCLQPGLSGDGEEYLARYFYSPEYRQCLHFIYSGKGGNENNFETQQDCIETCIANGVKFSSLASTVPQPTFSFAFMPAPICPQGTALLDANNDPLSCQISQCPNGYVCTTMGPQQFCCPAPESFCLEPRPAVSVCEKGGTPVSQIRFTYDPMSDKCVRFSFDDCNPTVDSLNSFSTQPQCSRLCCNQGYNLLYRRKVRMLLNDDPMSKIKRTRRI